MLGCDETEEVDDVGEVTLSFIAADLVVMVLVAAIAGVVQVPCDLVALLVLHSSIRQVVLCAVPVCIYVQVVGQWKG